MRAIAIAALLAAAAAAVSGQDWSPALEGTGCDQAGCVTAARLDHDTRTLFVRFDLAGGAEDEALVLYRVDGREPGEIGFHCPVTPAEVGLEAACRLTPRAAMELTLARESVALQLAAGGTFLAPATFLELEAFR